MDGWIAYAMAFAAALAGTLVGGIISWLLHRSTARRNVDLQVINAAYVLYGQLDALARADPSDDHSGWDTLPPKYSNIRQSSFRLTQLLAQRYEIRSLRERRTQRAARARRKSEMGDGRIVNTLSTVFADVEHSVRAMPTRQAVAHPNKYEPTLGTTAIRHMNTFQRAVRQALEDMPLKGIDHFTLAVRDAARRLQADLDQAKKAPGL